MLVAPSDDRATEEVTANAHQADEAMFAPAEGDEAMFAPAEGGEAMFALAEVCSGYQVDEVIEPAEGVDSGPFRQLKADFDAHIDDDDEPCALPDDQGLEIDNFGINSFMQELSKTPEKIRPPGDSHNNYNRWHNDKLVMIYVDYVDNHIDTKLRRVFSNVAESTRSTFTVEIRHLPCHTCSKTGKSPSDDGHCDNEIVVTVLIMIGESIRS